MAGSKPSGDAGTDNQDDQGPLLRQASMVTLATMYQNLAHSSLLAMQNAVQQQQNSWTVQNALTARLAQQILTADPIPYGDPLMDLFDDDAMMEDFDDEDLD